MTWSIVTLVRQKTHVLGACVVTLWDIYVMHSTSFHNTDLHNTGFYLSYKSRCDMSFTAMCCIKYKQQMFQVSILFKFR